MIFFQKAVELVEQYLIKTLNLGDAEKLLIAEQYMLESLMVSLAL